MDRELVSKYIHSFEKLGVFYFTASDKRNFLKLKLIKTYLRNTTTENKLNGLVLLLIHRYLALEITNNQFISLVKIKNFFVDKQLLFLYYSIPTK